VEAGREPVSHMVTGLPLAFLPGSTGGGEVFLVLVLALLLFGSKNLPRIARAIGRSLEQFRNASRDVTREIMGVADEPVRPPPPAPENTMPARPVSPQAAPESAPPTDPPPADP
jgi:TatA/E family protein of Tat protein translocase